MLITFIKTLKDSSRRFITDLLSILFSQLYITIKIISETSENAINLVIENCKCLDILPIILEKCKEKKSALLHEKCSKFVYFYLKVNKLEKSEENLKFNECLSYMLSDNDSNCRAEAKRTYELYKEVNKEECEKFYQSLSSDIQKRLNEKNRSVNSSISLFRKQMKSIKSSSKKLDEIEICVSARQDSKMSERKEDSKMMEEEEKENRKNFQASIISIPQDNTSSKKVKRQRDTTCLDTFDEERQTKKIHV